MATHTLTIEDIKDVDDNNNVVIKLGKTTMKVVGYYDKEKKEPIKVAERIAYWMQTQYNEKHIELGKEIALDDTKFSVRQREWKNEEGESFTSRWIAAK